MNARRRVAFVDINTTVMTSVARLTLTGVVVHLINTCSFEAVIEWLLMARIHTTDGSFVKTNHLTNHLSGINTRDGSSVWDELGEKNGRSYDNSSVYKYGSFRRPDELSTVIRLDQDGWSVVSICRANFDYTIIQNVSFPGWGLKWLL